MNTVQGSIASQDKPRWAVVTGGSRGIGAAITQLLLQGGWCVAICGRQLASLQAFQAQCSAPEQLNYYVADVSKAAECSAFAQHLSENGITPELLINNAGHFVPGALLDQPELQLQEMLDAHVMSGYWLTRAIAPAMVQQGRGDLVFITSIAAITAYPNGGAYAVAKAAQLAMARSFRAELKPAGVRVMAVLPGATYTDSWVGAGISEVRFMSADTVAKAIIELISLSKDTVVEELILRPQLGDI